VEIHHLASLCLVAHKEIHIRQKLCHFGRYVAKAKLFRLKSFIPVTQAGVFIWENFHRDYWDVGRKTQDLGNRASVASHMNTLKFLRRKEKRGEISETEPARLTGLIWRDPNRIYSHMKKKSVKLPFGTKDSKHLVGTCGDDLSALIEFTPLWKTMCQITLCN